MIEKILARLEAEADKSYNAYTVGFISDDGAEYDAYTHAIEIVQEVAKEYDWIPVEQKTPDDFTLVYATCTSLIDDRKPWVIEGVYHSVTGWEEMTPFLSWGKAKVIAWMPKKYPAPYQKGE